MESEKGIRCKSVAASTTVSRRSVLEKLFDQNIGIAPIHTHIRNPYLRHAASLRKGKTKLIVKATDSVSIPDILHI